MAGQTGIHLLVQEPLAVEAAAVRQGHDEYVDGDGISGIGVRDCGLVPDPVDLAFEAGALLDSDCHIMNSGILGFGAAEAGAAIMPEAPVFRVLHVCGPQFIVGLPVTMLPEDHVTVDR